MAFQLEGKLHRVFDTEQKTESFQAREFVVETADTQYPQLIKFQLTQDKCALIDNYTVGDELTVHFDLRGREWNERFFTNLNAWKIEQGGAGDSATATNTGNSGGKSQSASTPASGATADFDDDIPF